MTEFFGVDTALKLLPGLAKHEAKAIHLQDLEPDIERNPEIPMIAIVVIKAIGQVGWAHVAALVEGWGVVVDGPRETGVVHSVYPKSQAELDELVATIDRIATPWLADYHEEMGVIDATLAVRIMLRRLDPQQLYKVSVSSGPRGPTGWVHGYRGTVRIPASICIQRVDGGIELTSGPSKRVVTSMLALVTDFEATELPPIKADVAWSLQFQADLARARAVATAVMTRAQGRLMDHQWSQSGNLETYFNRTDKPCAWITGEGKWNVAGATFEGVPGGVKITCCDGFDRTVADPREAEAAIDDILGALKRSMMIVTAGGMRQGHRYKAKQLFYSAQTGEIVTFEGVEDQRVVEVWKFKKDSGTRFYIDDKDEILGRLRDYLEPVP